MVISLTSMVALTVLMSSCLAKSKFADLNDQLDSTDLSDLTSTFELFNNWQEKHQVYFQNSEESNRAFDALLENSRKIQQHRKQHRNGQHSYNVGLNKFSHLTFDEFKSRSLGYKSSRNFQSMPYNGQMGRYKRAILPASLNYTAQGYVTPVKDQGECGCCWTFSTTGVLEGAYFKKTGKLVSFSEQQLVECVQQYVGCDGGVVADAVDYVRTTGGIATEALYPYTSQLATYSGCKQGTIAKTAMSPTYTDILQDDSQLLMALVNSGPVAVSVAVGDPFMSYVSGIMDPATACVPAINHAVLLTGYGTDPVTLKKYWIVKNSWSTDWGEKGYFKLSRDVPNSCGINSDSVMVTM